MANVKIIVLLMFAAAFLFLVYKGATWYFNKKNRQDKLDALQRVQSMAEREAIWEDGDPETFDREKYEQELADAGLGSDMREIVLDRMEEGRDMEIDLEDL